MEISQNVNILIHRAVFLIQQFRTLLESYVTSYYCENGPKNLIPCWLKEPGLRLDDLCYLLSGFLPSPDAPEGVQSKGRVPLTRPLPLSLLAYRTACLSLQLNVCAFPEAATHEWISWQQNPVLFSNRASLSNLLRSASTLPLGSETSARPSTSCGDGSKRLAQFRRHVTPKKAHEIDQHAAVICTLARAITNSYDARHETITEPLIIDVGSGQGHLSRRLGLHHGLRVVNLEVDEGHVIKAAHFDTQTKSYLEKKTHIHGNDDSSVNCAVPFRSPVSVPLRITSATTSSELLNLISKVEFDDPPIPLRNRLASSAAGETVLAACANQPILLNGLHTCGDLSTTILRLFTELDCAQGVVTVGCCYMKSTTFASVTAGHTTDRGTRQCPNSLQQLWEPESQALRQFSFGLSYAMLEAACHSIGDYMRRLRLAVDTGDVTHLHVHGYRALLELLLKRRSALLGSDGPTPSTRAIRCSVKQANSMDFNTYSKRLLDRMAQVQQPVSAVHQKLFAAFTEDEIASALATIGTDLTPDDLWLPVVRYHVFRLMLTPVVETVILLDRLLHIQQQGFSACLLRVFDYTISPRNLAVIALRSENEKCPSGCDDPDQT